MVNEMLIRYSYGRTDRTRDDLDVTPRHVLIEGAAGRKRLPIPLKLVSVFRRP